MTNELLLKISEINKKYMLIKQKTGAYFNIFNIIDKSSDEIFICKILYELLNPNGSHYQGDTFLRLFVSEVLQMDFSEQDYKSVSVYKEYFVQENRRRIDLFIETVNYKIPIEVKINAEDQDKQCFDYYKRAKNANLYYLTRDGRHPSQESAEGLTPEIKDDEIIGYKEISLISFREDIIKWLDNCLALTEIIKIAPIREILLQFKEVLLKLTGQTEGGEKMEIVNTIISSAEHMQSAIDITSALPEAKANIMLNFLRELKRLFEDGKYKTYDYDEDAIKQYDFSRKQSYPYFYIEIKKFPYDLMATLCIYVHEDGGMYYSFAFTETKESGNFCDDIENEWVKTEYPDIYNAFENAVFDVVGADGEKTKIQIFWDYLKDGKGRTFDFKSFSSSCVDLASNYREQAKRIFDMLNDYVSAILNLMEGNRD